MLTNPLQFITDYSRSLKPAIERWVIPGWAAFASGQRAINSGFIYYLPIFVAEDTTYDRIGIYVTTGAAGLADLRIFRWENGLPKALVLSAGTADISTNGAKNIVISQALTRGYYFLAVRVDVAGVVLRGPDITKFIVMPVSAIRPQAGIPDQVIPIVQAAYADPAPAPTEMIYADYCMLILREA